MVRRLPLEICKDEKKYHTERTKGWQTVPMWRRSRNATSSVNVRTGKAFIQRKMQDTNLNHLIMKHLKINNVRAIEKLTSTYCEHITPPKLKLTYVDLSKLKRGALLQWQYWNSTAGQCGSWTCDSPCLPLQLIHHSLSYKQWTGQEG